jgi:2-octaprenyl-6-methoxyphenol hydroxylase
LTAEIEEGPMGFLLEDRFLYTAFHQAMAEEPRITLLSGESVVAQDIGAISASVTLASGRVLTGRVLVGCDGRGQWHGDAGGDRAHGLGL